MLLDKPRQILNYPVYLRARWSFISGREFLHYKQGWYAFKIRNEAGFVRLHAENENADEIQYRSSHLNECE